MSYKIKNKKLTICETFVGCGGGYLVSKIMVLKVFLLMIYGKIH